MEEELHPALLPAGLRDGLPPDAWIEADLVRRLLAALDSYGYQRVKPPIFEYETSLLGGPGAAMASETFRLMDPVSQRMIGLRADMTLQIARIATTRLIRAPRPLRLSYEGPVLRAGGTQLRPERQLTQVGAELIGSDAPAADAEIITLAAEALRGVGVRHLAVDLTLPRLVPAVLNACDVDEHDGDRLRQILDHKDAAGVEEAGGAAAGILGALIRAAGPADRAMSMLIEMSLPPEARAEVNSLATIVAQVRASLPDLAITVDPVENRGFEYHTGVSFSFFARDVRNELGRGGRYRAGTAPADEASTGFTLYADTVLRAAAAGTPPARLYLPEGTPVERARALRTEGWATVLALGDGDPVGEARRLGCSHVLDAGHVLDADGPDPV